MVVIMKPGFTTEQLNLAIREMEKGGVKVMISRGSETTSWGPRATPRASTGKRWSPSPA